MGRFSISGQLYAAPGSAMDELQRVCSELKGMGWTINNADYSQGSGWNTYVPGFDAVNNPITIVMEKNSGTIEGATADLKTALQNTGNYSLASWALTSIVAIEKKTEAILDNPLQLGTGLGVGFGVVVLVAIAGVFIYLRGFKSA